MEVHAITRNVRMSAQKMREMVRQIQGLNALQAQAVLAVVPRKSARFVAKTLRSAIANAENNADLKVDTLLVKEAVVGEGPTFKRFRARARGSASPLRKRTSHIRIVLADELASTAPTARARKAQSAEEGATVVADDQAKSESNATPRKSSGRKTTSRTPKGSTEGKTTKRQSSAKKEEKE